LPGDRLAVPLIGEVACERFLAPEDSDLVTDLWLITIPDELYDDEVDDLAEAGVPTGF
jgi:hypothetical protein